MEMDQYSNLTPKELLGRLVTEHANKLIDTVFSNPKLPDDKIYFLEEEYKKFYSAECKKFNKSVENPNTDTAPRLRFIIFNWEQYKPVFNYKSVARSYLYLIIEFRNQWAHNNPISNDEVVYAAHTLNRLAHIVQDFIVIKDVGSMIEYIDSKKAKSIIEQYQTSNKVAFNDENEEYNTKYESESVDPSLGDIGNYANDAEQKVEGSLLGGFPVDSIDRLALEALIYNEHYFFFDPDPGLVYETLYPIFFQNLSEIQLEVLEDGYKLLVDKIRKDGETNSLEQDLDLSAKIFTGSDEEIEEFYKEDEVEAEEENEWVGDDGISICAEGKYPDTLFFQSGNLRFSLGSYKLTLLILYISVLERFVNNELVDKKYIDNYKGYPVICIPSIQDNEIRLGKNKARIVLANQKNIFKWLYKNNKLKPIEDFFRS